MTRAMASLCGLMGVLALLAGCAEADGNAASVAKSSAARNVAIVRGEVDVEGGLVQVFSAQGGRLLTVNGRLGARVRAGDVLAMLDPHALQTALSMDEAAVVMAVAREKAAKVARDSAASLLARLKEAQSADAAPGLAVDQAQSDFQARTAENEVAIAEVRAATVRRDSSRIAFGEVRIRAPVSGELVEVHATPLLRVGPDATQPLFVLLPDAPRIIRAELGEEFAGIVHRGMSVEVAPEDGGPVVPGKATWVSSVLRRRSVPSDSADAVDGRVIPCEIEVGDTTLRVGQQVLVRFKADK